MEYAASVARLAEGDPDLAAELAGFRGVADVLAWMQRRGLTRTAVDIVGQDEFEYDFLIQLGPGGRWLALGIT